MKERTLRTSPNRRSVARVAIWLVAFSGLTGTLTLFAQPPGSPQVVPPVPTPGLVIPNSTRTSAIIGEPFGVATLEIPLATPLPAEQLSILEVSDEEGRVFYSTTRNELAPPRVALRSTPAAPGEPRLGGGRLLRRVGELVRQATADDDVPMVVSRRISFLFRGDTPLRVRISEPDAAGRDEFLINPVVAATPDDHQISLKQWWSGFAEEMRTQSESGDYPAIVENYLVALLAGRLNLPLPADFVVDASDDDPALVSTLNLIAGTEKIRSAVFRRAAIGNADPVTPASLPLPAEPNWVPANVALTDVEPIVEPLATRVPPECFFIRYGSFENYLWFRDLSEEYGGDIGRMIALRGSDDGAARRVETQLNLKTTALSRMLGSSVIEDQAIIGRDLYISEGASVGVLFRAKNAYLLQTSLNTDRNGLAQSDPEVTLTNETIAGHPATFLSTADNRVRSWMVVDGETILVTNSKTLATRFIEVGESGESLAATSEYRLARQLMPLDRGDTLFAYFSPGMLRGLVSPSYLIETRRRLYASADLSLVRLARLAATAEGDDLTELEDLVDAGYLPTHFGTRSDGSGVLAVGDQIIDSLRGRPGTLLPIADVEVESITPEEQAWYDSVVQFHETKWQQIDPLIVGVRRSDVPGEPSLQRLDIHAEVAPLVGEKYGSIARQLGPPTRVKIDFAPDDIVAAQAHVVSDQLNGTIPPHHLFAAIKDAALPAPEQFDGILKTYQALRGLPGYLGAWPQPGLLDRLPLGLGRGQVVGPGLTRLIGGVYRYQGGGFSIVSLQSDVLLASLPFLAATEAENDAQVRLHVGNLRGSQLEGWVNQQIYQKSTESSRAGASFLSLLTRQLRIPASEANRVAGELLGGKLQDPLGGNYTMVRNGDAKPDQSDVFVRWVSDAWSVQDQSRMFASSINLPQPPPEYVAPVLQWFRGGHAELTQYQDRLIANAVIDVQRRGIAGAVPETSERTE
jgi:hypothetical protein